MNKFVKNIPKHRLHVDYLRTLNGILDLTEREIQVLGALMDIQVTFGTDKQLYKSIVSTEIRKHIIKNLHVNKSNFVGYMTKFKNKGLIVTKDDSILINQMLFPIVIGDRVQVTIILKLDEIK